MEHFIPSYPDLSNPDSAKIIAEKKEFQDLKDEFLFPYQMFVRRFLSPDTPYNSILLFHNMGSGKSFSAIAVAEDHKEIFKAPLVLVKGNSIAENFRNQVREWGRHSKTNSYSPGDYEIKNFIIFSRMLSLISDSQIKKDYSNRVIIVDEIQNLRSSSSHYEQQEENLYMTKEEKGVYDQIWRLLHVAENIKVVLLSGTPMVDRKEEICGIMNLILPINLQIRSSMMSDEKYFISRIRGRVSFQETRRKMPNVVEEGQIIDGLNIPIIISKMKGIQKETYHKISILNEKNFVYRSSIYCSIIVFPDGRYGGAAYHDIDPYNSVETSLSYYRQLNKSSSGRVLKKKYLKSYIPHFPSDIREIIKRDGLSNYSCKIHTMMKIINGEIYGQDTSKDLVFVFCEEVKGSGLIMMGCVLEAFDYSYYQGENIKYLSKAKRYAILAGDKSLCKNPEKILKGFCSEENKHGEYIKILLGSKVSGEGINLSNIRQVHIMTPHWNMSSTSQAIARAIRTDSHKMLQEHERTIRIFRHAAIATDEEKSFDFFDPKISIDLYKYRTSQDKAKKIHDVKEILRLNSVDRYIYSSVTQEFSDYSTYLTLPSFAKESRNIVDQALLLHKCSEAQSAPTIADIARNLNKDNKIVEMALLLSNKLELKANHRILIKTNTLTHRQISAEVEKINNRMIFETINSQPPDVKPSNIFHNSLAKMNNITIKSVNIPNFKRAEEAIKWIINTSIQEKVKILEKVLATPNSGPEANYINNLFNNSIVKKNNKYYHILFSRKPDDNCSYTVSSEIIKARGKTRIFDNIWDFCKETDEIEVLKEIKEKSDMAFEELERKFGIVIIICNADNKIRIRNCIPTYVQSTSERSIKYADKRKINRGKYIGSFYHTELINIATYVFCHQVNIDKLEETAKWISSRVSRKILSNREKMIDYFLEKGINIQNSIAKRKDIELLIENKSHYLDTLFYINFLEKSEAKNLIVKMCVECGSFIIY